MTRHPRLAISALTALSIAVLLGGCSPDQWGLWTGGGGSSAPQPTGTTTPGGSTDDAPDPEAANGCPVGSWLLDNASWESELERIWAQAAPSSDVEVSGTLALDWDDRGGYLLTARSSQYVVTGVADGVDFVQTVRHDGTEHGAWTGAESSYELVASGASGMSSTVTLAAGGGQQVYDQDDFAPEPWSGAMTVTCTGGGMTTTVTEESGSLTVTWLRR